MTKMIMNLREYLKNTPKHEILQKWQKVLNFGFTGPLFMEYEDPAKHEYHVHGNHVLEWPSVSKKSLIELEKNDLGYSQGHFFLVIL